MHFVLGVSIKEIARRTGRDRNTIRSALRSATALKYSRPAAGSKLDPFKDEIHRLLKADAKLSGQRVRELIAPLGFDDGKTIVMTTCARCGRCLIRRGRFSARSIGRARSANSICGRPPGRFRSGMARPVAAGW